MIGARLLARWAPDPEDVRVLVAGARDVDPALADALVAVDLRLVAADPAGVEALLDLLDRAASVREPVAVRMLIHTYARLWSVASMELAPGDPVARHPLAWLDLGENEGAPLDPRAVISRVVRRGAVLGPGLILRPAVVELALAPVMVGASAVGPAASVALPMALDAVAEAARALEERIRGDGPAELVELLARRAAGPLPADLALALADHAMLWRSTALQADRVPDAEVHTATNALAGEAARLGTRGDAVVFPHPVEPGVELEALRTRWGRDAFQFRGRYSEAVPAGGLLWVERLGFRGPAARPARGWVSRGPVPPEVACATRALELVLAHGGAEEALAARGRRWVDDLGQADRELRVRALLELVNAVDQARHDGDPARAPALSAAADPLVAVLGGLGVHEVPIAVGGAFDRCPPDLYHVRRAQRPGARQGEILAVVRRAFREAGGPLLQQATIEVNLGES